MRTIQEMYDDFDALATVRTEAKSPPSQADLNRAAEAIGLSIPEEFGSFLRLFYDRQPPFWDVLRVQAANGPPVPEDIVEINRYFRGAHPDELERCLLIKDDGTGDYDCFIFSETGKVMGLGVWKQYEGVRGEPPSVLYDGWAEWFEAELSILRDE